MSSIPETIINYISSAYSAVANFVTQGVQWAGRYVVPLVSNAGSYLATQAKWIMSIAAPKITAVGQFLGTRPGIASILSVLGALNLYVLGHQGEDSNELQTLVLAVSGTALLFIGGATLQSYLPLSLTTI